jgi:hypothetical protein
MTTLTDISQHHLVELDERESAGIRVILLWNRVTDQASVFVSDEKSGEVFALEVRSGENALDVFHHPFAYAARKCCEGDVGAAEAAAAVRSARSVGARGTPGRTWC